MAKENLDIKKEAEELIIKEQKRSFNEPERMTFNVVWKVIGDYIEDLKVQKPENRNRYFNSFVLPKIEKKFNQRCEKYITNKFAKYLQENEEKGVSFEEFLKKQPQEIHPRLQKMYIADIELQQYFKRKFHNKS